jgi:tetratricopeptide (TPR) repeat protein
VLLTQQFAKSDDCMKQTEKTAAPSRKKTSPAKATAAKSAPKPVAPDYTGPAYQHYQAAVQLVQQGKYDKGLTALEKLLHTAPPAITERIRMYITTCRHQLEASRLNFQTHEERYNYAVWQLNAGFYEDAREHFEGVLSENPQADYAWYGLALLECITNHPEDALENLAKAIHLNPRNRLQARSDNDFQPMADDPRFTELLYPEP